jgi:hypothetical protein
MNSAPFIVHDAVRECSLFVTQRHNRIEAPGATRRQE